MALQGSIRDFGLADIFQLIGIQRKTGVLTLRQDEEEVKVSFLNGLVVNADSKSKRVDDRLGTVLVKTGKLSADNLKRALKLQKETLKKLGNILIEENMLRPEDLREALGLQITQIIYRLFRWKDGQYHFEQDVAVDYDKENFAPMSAENLLMEGMRMIDEWPIIERKITSFDMVFERVALENGASVSVDEGPGEDSGEAESSGDDFDRIFGGEEKKSEPEPSGGRIKLTRDENLVYQQVNGTATVQEIIDRVMLSEFEVCRALFDLNNRNLIVAVAREKRAGPAAARERARSASWVGRLIYTAIVVVALAALAFADRNPLNLFALPLPTNPALEAWRERNAAARVRRIGLAVDTFVLARRTYPTAARELLDAGLLLVEDLTDPWGAPVRFEVLEDRIAISIRHGEGPAAQSYLEERILPAAPAPGP